MDKCAQKGCVVDETPAAGEKCPVCGNPFVSWVDSKVDEIMADIGEVPDMVERLYSALACHLMGQGCETSESGQEAGMEGASDNSLEGVQGENEREGAKGQEGSAEVDTPKTEGE